MARLRAMRKGRKRGGALGGMLPGVTYNRLMDELQNAMRHGSDNVKIRDAKGREYLIPVDRVQSMLDEFDKMTGFWDGMSKQERSAYIKSHYLSGSTHVPWKNMTLARLIKIIKRTRKGYLPGKFIEKRGTNDFINQWLRLNKAPKDNKAKMFQALLKTVTQTRKVHGQTKIKKTRDFANLLEQLNHVDLHSVLLMIQHNKVKLVPDGQRDYYHDFLDNLDNNEYGKKDE